MSKPATLFRATMSGPVTSFAWDDDGCRYRWEADLDRYGHCGAAPEIAWRLGTWCHACDRLRADDDFGCTCSAIPRWMGWLRTAADYDRDHKHPIHLDPLGPVLPAFALLQELLSTHQWHDLRTHGFALEESHGQRFVIDFAGFTVGLLQGDTVRWFCVGPDRSLCWPDHIVTLLGWIRADPSTFLEKAVPRSSSARDALRAAIIVEAPHRERLWSFVESARRIADLIGPQATVDLHEGLVLFRRGDRAWLLGSNPATEWDLRRRRRVEHPVEPAPPGTSRVEHWLPVVERLLLPPRGSTLDATELAA